MPLLQELNLDVQRPGASIIVLQVCEVNLRLILGEEIQGAQRREEIGSRSPRGQAKTQTEAF